MLSPDSEHHKSQEHSIGGGDDLNEYTSDDMVCFEYMERDDAADQEQASRSQYHGRSHHQHPKKRCRQGCELPLSHFHPSGSLSQLECDHKTSAHNQREAGSAANPAVS